MANTKYFETTDDEAVNSVARQAPANSLPVFSLGSVLQEGFTPPWTPPHNIILTDGYVIAGIAGTTTAGFTLMKKTQPDIGQDDEVLVSFTMSAAGLKTVITLDNSIIPKTVTPYDRLYIASFAASGHENVTIQFFGDRY